jgi:zinc transport system substrate-binding protein
VVGDNLEAFLHKALESPDIAQKKLFQAAELPGIRMLPARSGGLWEPHHHEGEEEGAQEEDPDNDHDGKDPHIWMDPENAKVIARELAVILSGLDAENATKYRANAEKFAASMDALSKEIDGAVSPVRDKRYIVFHDAYQYFEKRYGLAGVGSITVSPEQAPGAKRLQDIQEKIGTHGARCVFREPNFEPALVDTVIAGTPARSGVLDPEGASLNEGADLYFDLLRGIADSLKSCLAASS